MKECGILFSAAMVRALLTRTKTQTRRVCKPADAHSLSCVVEVPDPKERGQVYNGSHFGDEDGGVVFASPYGGVGDRLWVRETFFAFGRWETRFSAPKGRDEWHFVDMTQECGRAYLYAANKEKTQPFRGRKTAGAAVPMWWKRPAIFMPRVASRILLEVTEVRVERLQDISDDDLAAEGIQELIDAGVDHDGTPRDTYRTLWEALNGPGSWEANPFVWAVSFKQVTS